MNSADVVTALAVVEDGMIWGWKWVAGEYRSYALSNRYYRHGAPTERTSVHVAVLPRGQVEAWFRQWPMHPDAPGAPAHEGGES